MAKLGVRRRGKFCFFVYLKKVGTKKLEDKFFSRASARVHSVFVFSGKSLASQNRGENFVFFVHALFVFGLATSICNLVVIFFSRTRESSF